MHSCSLLLALAALSGARAESNGTCVIVPKEESFMDYQVARVSTSRPRRYWCQANCPVTASVAGGHKICPYFDPAAPAKAASKCTDYAHTPADSCNQGFSGAACPPMIGPVNGSSCVDCVRAAQTCAVCDTAALCQTTNGFSVTHNGVTGSLGTCDNSNGELTTCDGQAPGAPCSYICTGKCERGFASSWNCHFDGTAELITRMERTTVDDASARCDLASAESQCMGAFLLSVQAGDVPGWELSWPLGGDIAVDAASRLHGPAALIAALAMAAVLG